MSIDKLENKIDRLESKIDNDIKLKFEKVVKERKKKKITLRIFHFIYISNMIFKYFYQR